MADRPQCLRQAGEELAAFAIKRNGHFHLYGLSSRTAKELAEKKITNRSKRKIPLSLPLFSSWKRHRQKRSNSTLSSLTIASSSAIADAIRKTIQFRRKIGFIFPIEMSGIRALISPFDDRACRAHPIKPPANANLASICAQA